MEQQTQPKKYIALAFVAGMAIVAIVWIVSQQANSYRFGVANVGSPVSLDYAQEATLSDSGKGFAPVTNVVGNMTKDRRVTNNYLSVHVKNVRTFHTELTAFLEIVKGKVMNENVTVSSDNQSESGTFTVLVPNKDADAFFALIEQKAIKIVDRQVNSYEITQEYTDIARQLKQYEDTYAKVLKFYDKAKTVSELLEIQNQLTMVQQNIDSLKGRQMALEELSSNTQYVIYSSTNEFNLPYVPEGTFEVAKTFKLAVRSLVGTSDSVVKGLVYVLVYAPLLAVMALAFWIVRKFAGRKS